MHNRKGPYLVRCEALLRSLLRCLINLRCDKSEVSTNCEFCPTHNTSLYMSTTGADALQLGLVDQLGGLQDAIEIARREASLSQEVGTSRHSNPMLMHWPVPCALRPLYVFIAAFDAIISVRSTSGSQPSRFPIVRIDAAGASACRLPKLWTTRGRQRGCSCCTASCVGSR